VDPFIPRGADFSPHGRPPLGRLSPPLGVSVPPFRDNPVLLFLTPAPSLDGFFLFFSFQKLLFFSLESSTRGILMPPLSRLPSGRIHPDLLYLFSFLPSLFTRGPFHPFPLKICSLLSVFPNERLHFFYPPPPIPARRHPRPPSRVSFSPLLSPECPAFG